MTAGRPSEYKESYPTEVDVYLATFETRGDVLPTKEGFCEFIGSTKPTIIKWQAEHPEFLYAIEKLEQRQARVLQNKGLNNEFNSTITKLLLSANHNMREKSDVTTNDKEITSQDSALATAALEKYLNGTTRNTQQ